MYIGQYVNVWNLVLKKSYITFQKLNSRLVLIYNLDIFIKIT